MAKKKKRISNKDASAKIIKLVDCRLDSKTGEVQTMKEPDFRKFVENNNLICFNMPTFTATLLAGERSGNDVWWPPNSIPGSHFTIHDTIFVDDPNREVWETWKCEHKRADKLATELLAEEVDVKEKQQRQQEQAAGKGRDKAKGKEKALAVTEPSVSYTDLRTKESFCVPKSVFCRSAPEYVVYMNFAALSELYVVDDMNKPEQSSTTPHIWHVYQEWEEFLTQEPVFMEESRPIHTMVSSQMVGKKDADDEHVEKELEDELPGHLGGTSAAGRNDEQHVYEHSGVQGLASTFVEDEEELKEQSQAEYSGGSQHAVEQGLASTSIEEELTKHPHVEYSGGPKHAPAAVQEALTLLKNKGDKATTKELCAAMCSIATGIFRSIEETNTRLDGIVSRLSGIDLRLGSRFDGSDSRYVEIDD